MVDYLSHNSIEQRACKLLAKYEGKFGAISPPVPVERIAENLLDLVIEWNRIPGKAGMEIYAGLDIVNGKIVLNENMTKYFDKYVGLYNTVLAHEIGHWELHRDMVALGIQRPLAGTTIQPKLICRSSGPRGREEWQAHSFMGFVLLPYQLLKREIQNEDLCDWTTLYYLREKYDVTISALTIRLQNLGLIYIEDGQIYPSKALAKGQAYLM